MDSVVVGKLLFLPCLQAYLYPHFTADHHHRLFCWYLDRNRFEDNIEITTCQQQQNPSPSFLKTVIGEGNDNKKENEL